MLNSLGDVSGKQTLVPETMVHACAPSLFTYSQLGWGSQLDTARSSGSRISFEKAAPRSQHSKDNFESETTRNSRDRSSTSATLNPNEAREGEGKSLQPNGVDSSFGQIGSD